jgi:hypothetical protein
MSIKRSALRITIWLVAVLLIIATCDYQSDFPREIILAAIIILLWIGGGLDYAYHEYKEKEQR